MKYISLGFTGTRKGMSKAQKQTFADLLMDLPVREFHYGNCYGADLEALSILESFMPSLYVISHPATITKSPLQGDLIKGRKKPLSRNTDIVLASDLLIAAPKGYKEEKRSGTWATIRRARKNNVETKILNPDGTVTYLSSIPENIPHA